MTRRVDEFPVNFSRATAGTTTVNTIRAATPVMGAGQWVDMGRAVNWLRGRGGTLVSANGYNTGVTAGGSVTFVYRVWPRYENHTRIWIVTLALPAAGGSAYGTITAATPAPSTAADWSVVATDNRPREFAVVHQLTTATDVPQEVTFQIASNGNSQSTVKVLSVELYEIPRTALSASYGAEISSLGSKNPIYENATASNDRSVEAVARHARFAKQVARKNHIFSWYLTDGVAETGSTFVDLFPLYPFACPRLLESGNTSRNLVWNAYAKVTGGTTTGEIKIITAAGSSTMAVTSTSASWHADHTTSVRCEDPTRWGTDGGIRTGTRDTLQIQIRRVGATSITIYGICVAEADNDPLTVLGYP